LSNLIKELLRRNVFKVGVVYIVVSWVVLQVAELLTPLLQLPDWSLSLTLYLALIGFPLVLVFAWAFELTPEGLKPTRDVHPDASITHETGTQLNRIIIGVMGLAILILLADRFLVETRDSEDGTEIVQEPQGKSEGKSIAVLPFVNMSNDPDQEYFSDGISEELINSLVQIRELRVAARTSSFAFKGKNPSIKEVGSQLDVKTVLEGSVRKSGNRIRITAQLINVEDGYHLWSETYDRDLTDIFAIQDDISTAIVEALKIHLLDGESLLPNQVINVEAYNFYLLARNNVRLRTEKSLTEALSQYEQVISLEPSYAPAWAGRATATLLLSEDHYGDLPADDVRDKAQEYLDQTFTLNESLAEAHAAQGLLFEQNDKPYEALESYGRAIKANPSEGIYYMWRHNIQDDLGLQDKAYESLQLAFRYDPLHKAIRGNLARRYFTNGDYDKARALTTPGTVDAHFLEAQISFEIGEYAKGTRELQESIALAEKYQVDQWKAYLNEIYFHNLKHPEPLMQSSPIEVKLSHQALIADPKVAFQELQDLQEDRECPAEFDCASDALGVQIFYFMQEKQFRDVIRLLKDYEIVKNLTENKEQVHDIEYKVLFGAQFQIYAQKQLEQSVETQKLAKIYNDVIKSRMLVRTDMYELLAVSYMLLDDKKAAMQSLEKAKEKFALNWDDLMQPWYDPLRSQEDFKLLKQQMQDHINTERSKLGWEPVTI